MRPTEKSSRLGGVKHHRRRERLGHDSGEAGLVAMLGITPALLVLTFGVLQYWFFSMASHEIEAAATEGARRAAMADSSFSDGVDYAQWFVTNAAVDGPISVTGSRGAEVTTMTVTGQCRWFIDPTLFDTSCAITRTASVATERFEQGVLP